MPKKLHKDIEILVDGRESCDSFEKAAALAIQRAVADGGEHDIDVNFMSKAGAKAWGGDDAVLTYLEDPDASANERITVKANFVGRVY
jgi:hypothetical protein